MHNIWCRTLRRRPSMTTRMHSIRTASCYVVLNLLAATGFAFAQNQPNGGWRRVGDPPANQPPYQDNDRNQQADPQNYGVPARLTIKAGTFVTVRINQGLSSDRNQPGDAFSAT